jgi:hypothetical protein
LTGVGFEAGRSFLVDFVLVLVLVLETGAKSRTSRARVHAKTFQRFLKEPAPSLRAVGDRTIYEAINPFKTIGPDPGGSG